MEKKTAVNLVINNIDDLYELIEKAQTQSSELKKTLLKIETFVPDVELTKECTRLTTYAREG
ncbi:hypothetical protein [Leuconostoc citreum]|uniref:hypothetical protein n=1 Tax=Leuconostoc citreum TaxID=33964 RepID=UPI00200B59B1|nr:hypothetical protein [Leuconostoc citreum]MCK8605168.1 hypothetical protein [Leuconostoc citreum]